MKMTIAKKFKFDAAHRLPNVDPEHKCYKLHGHTYAVEIICSGKVDRRGFVCDYDEIKDAWHKIEGQLDHQYLNDVPGLENPTTEALCRWIGERIEDVPVSMVRVYESSTTYCEMPVPWGK